VNRLATANRGYFMKRAAPRSALYPWFEEHGVQHVHPDDFERFKALSPYGKVFGVDDAEDGYVRLRYGGDSFRVKPTLLQSIPFVDIEVGQRVRLLAKQSEGVIEHVIWHHKERRPFFLVLIHGKRDSRRYRREELSAD